MVWLLVLFPIRFAAIPPDLVLLLTIYLKAQNAFNIYYAYDTGKRQSSYARQQSVQSVHSRTKLKKNSDLQCLCLNQEKDVLKVTKTIFHVGQSRLRRSTPYQSRRVWLLPTEVFSKHSPEGFSCSIIPSQQD